MTKSNVSSVGKSSTAQKVEVFDASMSIWGSEKRVEGEEE